MEPLLVNDSASAKQEQEKKPKTRLERLGAALESPKTILGISGLYLTLYIVFIGKEGGFTSQFLHFGPGTDDSNTTTFIGIRLDTWQRVVLMYCVSFVSAVMNTYYLYAMTNNLHSYIWNRAVPKVPFSKKWTYIVVLAEPFIMQVLQVTQFFTTLTMQIQFIIPQFIGSTLIEIPFTIQRLREKEYEFE